MQSLLVVPGGRVHHDVIGLGMAHNHALQQSMRQPISKHTSQLMATRLRSNPMC